mmetsp:Transcript_4446/g.9097  ORF Transcript_4446/g.9097 Transcript_4446/m.9097 type:complete len:91 (+) Transcript_4446:361-633(+)
MSVGMYVSIQVRTAVKEGEGVNAHTNAAKKGGEHWRGKEIGKVSKTRGEKKDEASKNREKNRGGGGRKEGEGRARAGLVRAALACTARVG